MRPTRAGARRTGRARRCPPETVAAGETRRARRSADRRARADPSATRSVSAVALGAVRASEREQRHLRPGRLQVREHEAERRRPAAVATAPSAATRAAARRSSSSAVASRSVTLRTSRCGCERGRYGADGGVCAGPAARRRGNRAKPQRHRAREPAHVPQPHRQHVGEVRGPTSASSASGASAWVSVTSRAIDARRLRADRPARSSSPRAQPDERSARACRAAPWRARPTTPARSPSVMMPAPCTRRCRAPAGRSGSRPTSSGASSRAS